MTAFKRVFDDTHATGDLVCHATIMATPFRRCVMVSAENWIIGSTCSTHLNEVSLHTGGH